MNTPSLLVLHIFKWCCCCDVIHVVLLFTSQLSSHKCFVFVHPSVDNTLWRQWRIPFRSKIISNGASGVLLFKRASHQSQSPLSTSFYRFWVTASEINFHLDCASARFSMCLHNDPYKIAFFADMTSHRGSSLVLRKQLFRVFKSFSFHVILLSLSRAKWTPSRRDDVTTLLFPSSTPVTSLRRVGIIT